MLNYLIKLNPIYLSIIGGFITFMFTMLGSSIVLLFKKTNKNIMDYMLSISAGVMLAASFWSLLNPAINMLEEQNKNIWLITSISFLLGGLFLVLTDILFKKVLTKRNESNRRNLMLILSITIHNIPEGLAVGVSFGALFNEASISVLMSAFVLTLGIGLQNFPEGSAVSLPLRREGLSRSKSFLLGTLSGLVEPISSLLGCLLVTKVVSILPICLSFAAGTMIYVVVSELIPESQTNDNKSLITMFTLVGFVIMMVLDIVFS